MLTAKDIGAAVQAAKATGKPVKRALMGADCIY